MRLGDIIAILDRIAPFELTEPWDNCGIMVGDPGQEIHSLILALNPSQRLIEHAIQTKTDLIITHHPLFFLPIKHLNLQDSIGAKTAGLIRNSIALVSMHTNLDKAEGGIADTLAKTLGLREVQAHGMLRTGRITGTALDHWVQTLPLKTARVCQGARDVHHVAVCPGSGMDLWREAHKLGCDTFVTGDVKYHDALDATEAGLNIVDAGHFGSEHIALKTLLERLCSELAPTTCSLFEEQDIFNFIKP